MGNGCSNQPSPVVEPQPIEDKPTGLKLSPSLENFVESVIAKRMEIHHHEIAITHQRLESLEKAWTRKRMDLKKHGPEIFECLQMAEKSRG